jgi:hypothetical protein
MMGQTNDVGGAASAVKPSVRWVWLGIALMIGSVIAGVVVAVVTVRSVVDRISAAATFDTPGTYTVNVDRTDTYVLFTLRDGQGASSDERASVIVRDQNGAEVVQREAFGWDSATDLDDSDLRFGSVIDLVAGTTYTVQTNSVDGIKAVLVQSPMQQVRAAARWLGYVVAPLLLLGLVMMIVALVKRRTARRRIAASAALAPAHAVPGSSPWVVDVQTKAATVPMSNVDHASVDTVAAGEAVRETRSDRASLATSAVDTDYWGPDPATVVERAGQPLGHGQEQNRHDVERESRPIAATSRNDAVPSAVETDYSAPRTVALGSAVPGSAVPGSAVPGSAVPRTAVPDSEVPEILVPETTAPDSLAPVTLRSDSSSLEPFALDIDPSTKPESPSSAPARAVAGSPLPPPRPQDRHDPRSLY